MRFDDRRDAGIECAEVRGRLIEQEDRIAHAIGRVVALVLRLHHAVIEPDFEVCGAELFRPACGAAHAEALVEFLRLRLHALTNASFGRDREEDVPRAPMRVQRRRERAVPRRALHRSTYGAETLVAAVGGIRRRSEIARVVLRITDESRGVPSSAVAAHGERVRASAGAVPFLACHDMADRLLAVIAPAGGTLQVGREHPAAIGAFAAGEHLHACVAPRADASAPLGSEIRRQRDHVHRAAHGEIPGPRRRGPLRHVDAFHRFGDEGVPVGVALGVTAHCLVQRHAVDERRVIGGVVGRESADRRVRGEARPLPLQMHFDAGRLAYNVPSVGSGHRADRAGKNDHAARGVGALRGRGDHADHRH